MKSIRNFAGRALSLGVLTVALAPRPAAAQVSEVVVGITPNCPYGISACWAGAHEALGRLENVESVDRTPDAYNCSAAVRLKGGGLPDPDEWAARFKAMVDQAYAFRGVEVTVAGTLEGGDGGLVLRVPGQEQPLVLRPLQHKLQWNFKRGAPRQPEPDEAEAYQRLGPELKDAGARTLRVQITGPLMKSKQGYILEVREFTPRTQAAAPPPRD